MAAVLRRTFVAIMCIGISLSAVDALGLICEYACASKFGHSHDHDAHDHAATQLNVAHAEPAHHLHLMSAEFLLSIGSADRDSDCSSVNVLVVAAGATPDVPTPDHGRIGVIDTQSYSMASSGYRVTAATGSPPSRAATSFPATPVSLRI